MSVPLLNRRLVLESPSETPDGSGGRVPGWTAQGTLWAEIRPRSGREIAGPGGTTSLSTARITVRGAPPGSPRRPRPDQRFREGARLFHVLAVTEADPSGRYLVCEAREEIVA